MQTNWDQTIKILSSEDLGDPKLDDVIQWHISLCEVCSKGIGLTPRGFGLADMNHCDEYWEIVREYAEYEAIYAWKGNP